MIRSYRASFRCRLARNFEALMVARICCAAAISIILLSRAGAAATGPIVASYVVLGPDAQPIARAITTADSCPALSVDGRSVKMEVRSPAGTVAQRPTESKPELSKPSVFSATVCEAAIQPGARRASIAGAALPLPPSIVRRIVVIGDTGCRIKAADDAVQDCNDPNAYPFAAVTASAAAWKPDIVLHVGDYLYRENPCPASKAADCADTKWGYGLDAWQADFLTPAAPLLKAAPWVMVRGNHETCARAGQGWRRFFDVYALTPARTCDDPANDLAGNFTDPFAVPLGDGAQIIVWDTASAANKPFAADDPRGAAYLETVRKIFDLAKQQPHNILTNHHPVLAVTAKMSKKGKAEVSSGNPSLQAALAQVDPGFYPAGIDLLLSGHVHVLEQLSFGGKYPSQFVTGFSGTQEDIVPLPESLSDGDDPAPGATPDAFSSWVDGFGFMTLERTGPADWTAEIHDKTGKVVNHCTIRGRESHCDIKQVHVG
jgi:hypothetical protein